MPWITRVKKLRKIAFWAKKARESGIFNFQSRIIPVSIFFYLGVVFLFAFFLSCGFEIESRDTIWMKILIWASKREFLKTWYSFQPFKPRIRLRDEWKESSNFETDLLELMKYWIIKLLFDLLTLLINQKNVLWSVNFHITIMYIKSFFGKMLWQHASLS